MGISVDAVNFALEWSLVAASGSSRMVTFARPWRAWRIAGMLPARSFIPSSVAPGLTTGVRVRTPFAESSR
jgi:hypothetical protein